MPRAKIRREDRQRSIQACLSCRASKIRCDSQLPCSACKRRDRSSVCTYGRFSHPFPVFSRRNPHPFHSLSNESRISVQDEITESTGPPVINGVLSEISPVGVDDDDATRQLPRDRMLFTSRGSKVYIGETASLSFLHFLQKVIRQCDGPTSFTDGNFNDLMLEGDIEENKTESCNEPQSLKREYLQCYLQSGSAILSLLTELELDSLLTGSERPEGLKPDDLATLYIAIAIGSQARSSCSRDKRCATKYASRGRQIAFDGMLMDPSLSMVRNFLLMAFYMLGACRRNTAFVYLGVATRAAIAIGLHAESNKSSCYQGVDYFSRRRTWKSLCTLNIAVCSLFGRPSGLPLIETGHTNDENSPALNSTSDALARAIFEVSLILEQISQKICRQERMNIGTVEAFLQQLRQWSRSLPSELRHFSCREGNCTTFADRRVLIGNMHVSCFYYFAVISVTRPFFIQHLISHLRSNRNKGIEKTQETKVAALAQACISSAIYVVELCAKASESGLLLANMCLIQAFVFGAGLILGFSSFTGEVTPDPRDAFYKARTVLERLGAASPQARHYCDILTDFSHAIDKYRERITCEEGREIYAYVDRILTIDNNKATERQKPLPDDRSDSQPGYPDIATSDYFSAEQPELSPRLSNALDLQIHWDEISEQQFTSLNIDGLLSDVVLDAIL